MTINYWPRGVCTKKIVVVLDEDKIVRSVRFIGGCDGNTKGIAALAAGRPADELIEKLSGIRCESKDTSCPAQFAIALQSAKLTE